MNRWMTVVLGAVLVVAAAMGLRNLMLVASTTAPVPPTPWSIASTTAPVPPTPWNR